MSRKINVLCSAVFATLVFSAVVLAPGAAAVEWLKAGKALTVKESATTVGTIIIVHKGGIGGNTKIECSGSFVGSVGPGGAGEVTLLEKGTEKDLVKCKSLEGSCTEPVVHVEHLNWSSSLKEEPAGSAIVWNKLTAATEGPSYEALCVLTKVLCAFTESKARWEGNTIPGTAFSFKGAESGVARCSDGGEAVLESKSPSEVLGFTVSGVSGKPAEREVVNGGNAGFSEGYQSPPCVGKPVNCANGALVESQTDLAVGGRGPKLAITRSYNSLVAAKAESSAWGFGWSGPYSAHLGIETETVTVYQSDGSTVVFHLKEGKYAPAAWVTAKLVKEGTPSIYIYTLPNQTKLEFNSSGQLTSETDRNGNKLTMAYNAKSQLESVSDEAARKLTFAYNAEGEVESAKDPLGHTVKYTYTSGNLTSVTLPGEEKTRWKFEYSTSHGITLMIDGRANATTIEYDASHRVTLEKDPLLREGKFAYKTLESGGMETTITEPNGSKTVDTFNASGEPLKITRASGTELASTTTLEYNASDEKTATIDPNEHKTEYGYDAEGNKTSEKDPNLNETKWEYNSTHDIVSITTPKGEKTTIKRDTHGNPEALERTVGGKLQKTSYKYDLHGDLTEETNPLENTTKYEYDSAGNRTAEIDPAGDKRTWKYNEDSQVTSEVSPRGNVEGGEPLKYTTSTERDAQGRPVKVTDPLGHAVEYTYDGNSNLLTVVDANLHTTKYVYNADNERTEVVEPKSTTKTGYDSEGQITSQTDGNLHTTKYERNTLEEITEEIDPLLRKTKKKYDKAGALTEVEDAEFRKTTYKYDPGNRLTEVVYSEGVKPTVKYEYDKDGHVTKMVDSTGETTYTYDEIDRMTESKDAHGDVTKYEYDLANEQTKITYPNAKTVTRAYDKAGRLEKVTDWNTKETKFSYNPDSQLTATAFPASTKNEDKYSYNEADQLTEVKMSKEAETLASLVYTRDKNGQIEKTVSKGLPGEETTGSAYDEDNRLIKYGPNGYEYDAANNPTKEGLVTYAYDAADQIEKAGETTFTYDKVGDRTKAKPGAGPETVYEYNQAGVLTGVKRTKEGEIGEINDSFTYDGNNLRASQTISGTTTHLAWDPTERLPLLLSDETNSYIYGPGGIPVEQISSGGETLYLHHDQQGSTRLLTNGSGVNQATYTYDAYGNLSGSTGAASTPLRYDSQYTNTDTGLIYLRARVYDPQTAQFLTLDPAVSSTGAPYSYALDNPLTGADPTGLGAWPWEWSADTWKVVGAGVTIAAWATATFATGGVAGPLLAASLYIAAGTISTGIGINEIRNGNTTAGLLYIATGQTIGVTNGILRLMNTIPRLFMNGGNLLLASGSFAFGIMSYIEALRRHLEGRQPPPPPAPPVPPGAGARGAGGPAPNPLAGGCGPQIPRFAL